MDKTINIQGHALNLSALSAFQLETLIKAAKDIQINRAHTRIAQQEALNTIGYAGKTYKNELGYWKVLTGKEGGEKHLFCLFFPEIPSFKITNSPDDFKGFWVLDSFAIRKIHINFIEGFEEIEGEEWNKAFDKHIEILKGLEVK